MRKQRREVIVEGTCGGGGIGQRDGDDEKTIGFYGVCEPIGARSHDWGEDGDGKE